LSIAFYIEYTKISLGDIITLFSKKLRKNMFFMFAQKNQKAVFFGTPRPKKYLTVQAVNVSA